MQTRWPTTPTAEHAGAAESWMEGNLKKVLFGEVWYPIALVVQIQFATNFPRSRKLFKQLPEILALPRAPSMCHGTAVVENDASRE